MIEITKAVCPTREELLLTNEYSHVNMTIDMIKGFQEVLRTSGNETDIHKYLAAYPELFYGALYRTGKGHHGMKVLSKQMLTPKTPLSKGMIPDFIVGGDSSEGWGWFIIELKGYNEPLFSISESEIFLSSIANRGVCQLLEYIDKGSEIQTFVRDTLGLLEFRDPHGILIIGSSDELRHPRKKILRRVINNLTPRISIINYDSIYREISEYRRQV